MVYHCRYIAIFSFASLWQNNKFQATYYLLYDIKYNINHIEYFTEHIFVNSFSSQRIHIFRKNLHFIFFHTF